MSLHLRNICKSYQDKKVLESLTYSFEKPGVYAIAGPNGIGKSTLFRIIAGAEAPSSGSVELDGLNPELQRIAYRQKVSWAPEMDGVFPFMTPDEYFRLILRVRGLAAELYPVSLIEQLALTPFLQTRFEELSLGNKKKTLLIGALMGPSAVLLLDEACTGFDRASQLSFKNLMRVRASQSIILLVNHDADQLQGMDLIPLQMQHQGGSFLVPGDVT